MFEISKVRKTCVICHHEIYKGERYFRTWEKGKATCWRCLEEGQTAIKNNKKWIKDSEDFRIVKNDTYNCAVCSTNKSNTFLMINYSYSARSYRGW